MGAQSKSVRKIRTADEFGMTALLSAMAPPVERPSIYSWSLEDIFAARDQQIRGNFLRPAQLAILMRTSSAIAVARRNRLAPQRCIRVELKPAKGGRGSSIAKEAEASWGQDGVSISPGALANIDGCLADHGVAFGYNSWTERSDGTRTDCKVEYWPIANVRWDVTLRTYLTRVHPDVAQAATGSSNRFIGEVPITHGDGRWVIFAAQDYEPFNEDAAVVDGCQVYARHALAYRDWAKSSVAHGSAKIVAEMPQGVPLQNATGGQTAEAAAFMTGIRSLLSSDAPAVIIPAGAKVDFVANSSTAWQVFSDLVTECEKDAARIYLGTDGTLGAQGGAPGVDISVLFGVATTKVQGALGTISRCLGTGSIEPWIAINFGDSSLAPTRRYMMPDADGDADRASAKRRVDAFQAHVKGDKDLGFVIDQDYVDDVAALYDVEPPQLPKETDAKVPTIALAPTDLAQAAAAAAPPARGAA